MRRGFLLVVSIAAAQVVTVHATSSQSKDRNIQLETSETNNHLLGIATAEKDYSSCTFPACFFPGECSCPVFPRFPDDTKNVSGYPYAERYQTYIKGCYKANNGDEDVCHYNEKRRMESIREQPNKVQRLMGNTLTSTGYAKRNVPQTARTIIEDFYDSNWHAEYLHYGPRGLTFANDWDGRKTMIDVKEFLTFNHNGLPGKVMNEIRPLVEEWIQQPVTPTFMNGIVVFYRDSQVAPHIQENPLVVCGEIHVDELAMAEPWPLELTRTTQSGEMSAVNITLKPGEMVLYEATSVVSARPFPLNGHWFSYLTACFEPVGYTQRFERIRHRDDAASAAVEDPKALYELALKRDKERAAANEATTKKPQRFSLPHYISEEKEGELWRQAFMYKESAKLNSNSNNNNKIKIVVSADQGLTAHTAAARGNLKALKALVEKNPKVVNEKDENGWQPIHEAARSGHKKVLKYLVEMGANVNERTNHGRGGTPLWWAMQNYDENHPSVKYLISKGALNQAPQKRK